MANLCPAGAGDEGEEKGIPGQLPWVFDCEPLYVVPGARAFGSGGDGHSHRVLLSRGSRQNRVIHQKRDFLGQLKKESRCGIRIALAGKGMG